MLGRTHGTALSGLIIILLLIVAISYVGHIKTVEVKHVSNSNINSNGEGGHQHQYYQWTHPIDEHRHRRRRDDISGNGNGNPVLSTEGVVERGRERDTVISTTGGHASGLGEANRPCTAGDLLPSLDEETQDRWVPLGDGESRRGQGQEDYNCSCPYSKASYVCEHGRSDYPSWVPAVLRDNECIPVDIDLLAAHPFPPGSSILFYGNSHLRQAVEGIMCRYAHMVVRREVLYKNDHYVEKGSIDPLGHCRGFMTGFAGFLSDQGCLQRAEAHQALRCNDDRAIFELEDGTNVHFFFATVDVNKSIDAALEQFGTSPVDYDFAVFNAGNLPAMPTEQTLDSAQRIHQAGGSFVWLTTYDGQGDVRSWSSDDQEAFLSSKATYIAVHSMMATMRDFTRGAAEGGSDSHFCLPGPPDQLGLLLLRVLWALFFESHART